MLLFYIGPANLAIYAAEQGIGDVKVSGMAATCLLLGGTLTGLIFGKISAKFKIYTISLGFAVQAAAFGLACGNLSTFINRMVFTASVYMEADLQDTESAGIILLQNNANQLRLECICGQDGKILVRLLETRYRMENNIRWFEEKTRGTLEVENTGCFYLKVEGNKTRFTFYAGKERNSCRKVAEDVDGSFLGSETAGGFVGTYLGMYASGNGKESPKEAKFYEFSFR